MPVDQEGKPVDNPPPVETEVAALPPNRFGANDLPNVHILRDTSSVLLRALEDFPVATVAETGFKDSDPEKVLNRPAPDRLGFSGAGYDVGSDSIAALQPKANNALLSDGFPRLPPGTPPDEINADALSNMLESMRAVPLDGFSGGRATGRAELTLTPKPVTIVPTPYPDDPTTPLVVHGFVQIDTRSAAFVEFRAKIDGLVAQLTKSNEIVGDTRDQLLAEFEAGMSILTAPKPDPNLIEVLLKKPLIWITCGAGTGIISALANDAVQLLYHLLSQGSAIPL